MRVYSTENNHLNNDADGLAETGRADNNLLIPARNVLLTCKSSNHLKMSIHSGERWAFNAGITVVDYYSRTIWQTARSSLRDKTPAAESVIRSYTATPNNNQTLV